MLKIKSLAVVLLAAVSFTISSCKKDEVKTSKTDLLTAKKWYETKVEILGVDVTDDFASDCAKDDYIGFSKDGKFTYYNGTVKCDAAESSSEVGTWAWKQNETIITTINDGDTTDFKLIDLTSSTFKASTFDEDTELTATLTFTGK